MIRHRRSGDWRHPLAFLVLSLVLIVTGCSDSGDPQPCTSCPPPPAETGAVRLDVAFDDAAKAGLETAGFSVQDLERIDLVVSGANGSVERSLEPAQNRAFVGDLKPGPYLVTATAYGEADLVLFNDAVDVTVVAGDTASATMDMVAALGTVTLEIAGETGATVEGVAGEDLPFVVTVRNTQGRPVPGATVRLTKSTPDYGEVLFDGSTETNAQGQATGVIRAAFSGQMDLSLEVDQRPVSSPGPSTVVFETAVVAARSDLGDPVVRGPAPFGNLPVADGEAGYEYVVQVRNADGNALPGVPVTPTSTRNLASGMEIDTFVPGNGYEDWKTDLNGTLRFKATTHSSSFLHVDEDGRLSSEGTNGTFTPFQVVVVADGVEVGRDAVIFNSISASEGGSISAAPLLVDADGQDSATVTVTASKIQSLGGGPAENVYVEIVDVPGNVLNHVLDFRPLPGYEGFRTDAQGVWKGELRSTEEMNVFMAVKIDGRAVNQELLASVFFQ